MPGDRGRRRKGVVTDECNKVSSVIGGRREERREKRRERRRVGEVRKRRKERGRRGENGVEGTQRREVTHHMCI